LPAKLGFRQGQRRTAGGFFQEIYISTPADVCESRDPKGHYAKARAGGLKGFTGLGKDYEAPTTAELTIDTSDRSVAAAVDEMERLLVKVRILLR
jgi:bifunctional enzyme CysN/CysC